MKIHSTKCLRASWRSPGAPKRREGGSAVFILVALLAIIMVLVNANSKALFQLRQDINLLEQQQVKRLNASQTNAAVNVELTLKPDSI